ncbi:MAG: ATP-binding protein [Nocardioidaceae bacterium]
MKPPPTHVGIRTRVLGVAVTILVVTLVVWAWVVIVVFDGTLARSARNYGDFQAAQLADQLTTIPADLVVPTGRGYGDVVLQVLDADGRVVATSDEAASEPMTSLRPAPGAIGSEKVPAIEGVDEDSFVVVARGTTGPDGERLVAVVANPVHVEEGTISRLVLVGVVAGLLVLGITTVLIRWAVGAALTPVERMRGQLAGIDGHTFGDRVVVPTTGDELTSLGDTMNQMLERLEGAYAAQKAFVSDASHELRSPLATIRAGVELASADPTGRVWADTRDTLMAEILRLQALVDDLLTLSRYDAGALPLRLRECDLDDVVVQAVRRARLENRPPVDVVVEPVRALADPDRLGQVLRNLLDNAARHAATGTRVRLVRNGDSARVTVDNDGPPVPEDQRAAVFERFVRLDQIRDRDSGGTGLGLAIAADLVRAHGGTIATTEGDDGWCRFEFTVPAGGAAATDEPPLDEDSTDGQPTGLSR